MNGEWLVGPLILFLFLLVSYVFYFLDGKPHGGFWNRHKWRYETWGHRICTVCGETQEAYQWVGGTDLEGWYSLDFDMWKKGVREEMGYETEKDSQKQKAQQYVQSLTNKEVDSN